MSLEDSLETALSTPTGPLKDSLRRLGSRFVVLGASGKMGPTLVRLLTRGLSEAGLEPKVTAIARFTDQASKAKVIDAGATALEADLTDPDAFGNLPEAPNVIHMVGQKFGTRSAPGRTWAINALSAGLVAHRYRGSRIAVFSTGNVYPLWPADSDGPTEQDPVGPIGEYAESALARERLFENGAALHGTKVALLRVNYAIEPRYGILREIANKVMDRQPIDVTTGRVNLIWQRDANEIAIRSLEHAGSPPTIFNVTRTPAVRVEDLALAFGKRFGIDPIFRGTEAPTALLSNARLGERTFGPPPTSLEAMIDAVARWIETGGRDLGKPTNYEVRDGRF